MTTQVKTLNHQVCSSKKELAEKVIQIIQEGKNFDDVSKKTCDVLKDFPPANMDFLLGIIMTNLLIDCHNNWGGIPSKELQNYVESLEKYLKN